MTPQKIVIIGCPGSGKTVFASKLACQTGLPLIHLDSLYHDKKFDFQSNKQAWRNKVTELASQPSWIIDGNYKSSFDIRLPAAEQIIFFDFPRRVQLWRLFKRRIQFHNRLRNDMPTGWREKIDGQFLKFVWQYNQLERTKVYDLLSKLTDKSVVVIKSSDEAEQFLGDASSITKPRK